MKEQAPLAQPRPDQVNATVTREEKAEVKLVSAFAGLSESELLRLYITEIRQLARLIHAGNVEEVRRLLAIRQDGQSTSIAA